MGELEMDSRPFPAPLPHGIPVPFPPPPVSRLRARKFEIIEKFNETQKYSKKFREISELLECVKIFDNSLRGW